MLLAILFLAPLQDSPPLQARLEHVRKALGVVGGSVAGTELQLEGRGRARALGVDGELRVVLSTGGSSRVEVRSDLPMADGFDGRTSWHRDSTGLARATALEQPDRAKVLGWVLSGYWSVAPELALAAEGDGDVRMSLSGTPLVLRLTLDAESGLPRRMTQEGSSREWTFEDYRLVAGRRIPHRWVVRYEGDEERFELTSLAAVPPSSDAFRTPLGLPKDHAFELASGELVVGHLPSGHLYVEPLLEGEALGAFVFDTGAGITVIDRRVADELHLERLGETVAEGVVGTTSTSFRRGETFQLGAFTLSGPIYGDIDLGFAQASSGPKIAGIVGHDVLARCVVEIECKTPRIVLHDPARFTLAGAEWQPLVLQEGVPCVPARFEGERAGLFRLDTGAGGLVTFHTPAVEALRLLEGRTLGSTRSGGVGGSAEASTGTLDWFELAGHRFEDPAVTFSRTPKGAFSDAYTLGNLGRSSCDPFRIVLDLSHERVAFVPLDR